MTPELLEAMKLVEAGVPFAIGYVDACELIARYLVEHAGELVRKVKCWKCNGSQYVACAYCHETGYTLEPLTAKGDA